MVGKIKFEDRIRELVADHSFVAAIAAPLLEARAALRAQFAKLYQSGENSRTGRISRSGDVMLRSSLYEAALVVLTGTGRWNPLKAWGIAVARRRGMQKAMVAVDGTSRLGSSRPMRSAPSC